MPWDGSGRWSVHVGSVGVESRRGASGRRINLQVRIMLSSAAAAPGVYYRLGSEDRGYFCVSIDEQLKGKQEIECAVSRIGDRHVWRHRDR